MTLEQLIKELVELNNKIPLQADTQDQTTMVQIKGGICAILACFKEDCLDELLDYISPLATKILLEKLQKAQNSYKNN